MIDKLILGIKNQEIPALSKSITIVENKIDGYRRLLNEAFDLNKKSFKIGITGPPGAGKSSLLNKISKKYLDKGKSVGVICVDPSSPFNGGSILGDRIRLNELYNQNIFIRSIASRGALGGLFASIPDIDILYNAFRFDVIIYETVGVGQIELDIMDYSDTVILTITPESGDDIQMMKSGLLECADIIAINKSDREGADKLVNALDKLSIQKNKWNVPIMKTVAIQDIGIDEVIQEISNHNDFLFLHNIIQKQSYSKYFNQIKKIAFDELYDNFFNDKRIEIIRKEVKKTFKHRLPPYRLYEKIKRLND